MSASSRRSWLEVKFDGVDITNDMRPYFLSCTYTDNEDGESDDLQIVLQDREKIWMKSWLNEMVSAAAGENLKINATIKIAYWNGQNFEESLPCGEFELDSVSLSGPPNTVTIKASSLPFSSKIRQTKKSKAWESYSLSAIGAEIAGNAGIGFGFLSSVDPYYDRVEQSKKSDITFLQTLCKNAGLNIKATDGKLIIYDQHDYETRPVVIEANYQDTSFTQWKLSTQQADTEYASCRVSYVDPATGQCIEYTAYSDDYDDESTTNQQLEIYARVSSVGEAQTLAEKNLRLHNKFSRTIQFTHTGHVWYVAGAAMQVTGYGMWDGKYLCTQAKHTINGSGYTTTVTGRRIMTGYSSASGGASSTYSAGASDSASNSQTVRIGTVSAVNKAKRKARVIFRDEGITSGWLPVMQHYGANVIVKSAGRHDHEVEGDCVVKNTTLTPLIWYDEEGEKHESYDTAHTHGASLGYWMPKVNDTVVCLYLPTFNGDGVILGAT